MAGGKSNYLEAKILDLVLGATAFTAPATVYIALSTAAYSDAATGAAMNEVSTSGTAYGRVAMTNNATNWPAASGTTPTTKSNGTTVAFTQATASWGTVLSFYIVDNATVGQGNVLYGGDLAVSKAVGTGDTASFAVGTLVVTED